MNKFKNPLDPQNIEIKKAIRQWVIERFKLNMDVSIDITEHQCTEASCVNADTVICVADTEGESFYKISKPLVYVRKIDIAHMQPSVSKPKIHQH